MKQSLRTGIFLALGTLTLLACLFMKGGGTGSATGVIVRLPTKLPSYDVVSGEMSKAERTWLPDDTIYLKRTYLERGLDENIAAYRAVHATLIVEGSDSRSLHRPEVCLTGQGWTITSRTVRSIPTPEKTLEVMDFALSRPLMSEEGTPLVDENGMPVRQRAHYFYWWVGPGDSTPYDEERVWKSTWNSVLTGTKERWAYPSVMALVDERLEEGADEETLERLSWFVARLAPEFQKSLGAGAEQ